MLLLSIILNWKQRPLFACNSSHATHLWAHYSGSEEEEEEENGQHPPNKKLRSQSTWRLFLVVLWLVVSVGHLLAKGQRQGIASNWLNAWWVGSLVRRKTCPSCPVEKWTHPRCFVNELLAIAGLYVPILAFLGFSISWHPTVKQNILCGNIFGKDSRELRQHQLYSGRFSPFLHAVTSWHSSNCNLNLPWTIGCCCVFFPFFSMHSVFFQT